jgi:hypothetical protein
MKTCASFLSRLALLALLATGLLAGSATSLTFAKEKAASKASTQAKEASTMTASEQPKSGGKRHQEKKHHKGNKGEMESPEATSTTK